MANEGVETIIALELGGRVNKQPRRSETLYLLDADIDHHELDGQLVSDLTYFHGETWAATSTPRSRLGTAGSAE